LITKNILWSLLVFLTVFLIYISSPIITSSDSHWSIHTSLSIIKKGDTNLNEYGDIANTGHYAIEEVNGDLYSIFPIGASLLAVPFVAIADIIFAPLLTTFPEIEEFFTSILLKNGIAVDKLKLVDLYLPVELIIASFFCAVTAVVIFLISRLHLPISFSLLVVFIFAFCTSSWSVSSRALWQHGPSMLMLSMTLYFILLEDNGHIKGIIKYTAIPLALAFIIRPTNAVPIVFISIYILINYRNQFVKYVLIALPVATIFFLYNFSIYGSLLSPYYLPERIFHLQRFFEALAGNLISPSRGLLIYSPILILSFWLMFKKLIELELNSISVFLIIIVFGHWVVISSLPFWWGGHSYGPRFFADMIPFFIYFIILFMVDFRLGLADKRTFTWFGIILLITISFYINARGAYNWDVHQWNIKPNNIDSNPERLWDWHDLAFMR